MFGLRAGPEVRAQSPGAVLEGRGTATAALGGISNGQATQFGIPLSLSSGVRFADGETEGTFESGGEFTSVGKRFGFRSSVRIATQLGTTNGGYAGVRGGPVLMLQAPRNGKAAPSITLEALAAVGTGGDIEGSGLFGACLSLDLDAYSDFKLKIPSGRPFRCEDGSTWRAHAQLGRRRSPTLGRQLCSVEREQLGLSYLEDGLDEHASVPAFERLALELAAHGAPRSLIARARAAADDELRHARTCFALATAYLGRDVAVPSLRQPQVRQARALAEIAHECLVDGCIGEAAAAQVVLERARSARAPSERHALARIASEEHGHAQLAADIVAWMQAG